MYAGLSKAQKEEAQAIFNYLDRGQKGYLTPEDLREALESFSISSRNSIFVELEGEAVEEMMLEGGMGEKITLAGFITIIGHRLQSFDRQEEVLEALEPFLEGERGNCMAELREAMTGAQGGLTGEEWERLFSQEASHMQVRDLVRLLTVRGE